jgi:hypothetical protein
MIYYTIVCLKHLKNISIQNLIIAQWHSLFLCYIRLELIICRKEEGLIEYLIQKHMKFPPQSEEWGVYIHKCSLLVIAQLGLSRIHPHASVEESHAILKWSQSIMSYCSPVKVLDLLETFPVSPGLLIIKGLCWLNCNQQDKAKWCILRASGCIVGGAQPESQNLNLVLPITATSSLQGYFKYYLELCFEKGYLGLCVEFGMQAIRIDVISIN